MALRPVSELGLVEVTDVATPEASAPRRRHKPPQPRPKGRQQASATRARTTPVRNEPATTRSFRAEVATSVVSGAVGLAGALLVGRAILRR